MKSKAEVLKQYPHYAALIKAVIRKIGKDSIQDVLDNGMSGGFSGLIYYHETMAFYRRHRKSINKLVMERADETGEDPVSFVDSFACMEGEPNSPAIGTCVYGGKLDACTADTTITENALAWFAAEEVCRMFEELN